MGNSRPWNTQSHNQPEGSEQTINKSWNNIKTATFPTSSNYRETIGYPSNSTNSVQNPTYFKSQDTKDQKEGFSSFKSITSNSSSREEIPNHDNRRGDYSS